MSGRVPDPRHRPRLTWGRLLAAYAVVTAIPVALWAVSQPLAAAAVLAGLLVAIFVFRRTVHATRCLRDCRGFAVHLGDDVRITLAWRCDDASC